MDAPRIFLYDTTLRDGTQGEKISFSVEDEVRIARRLDEFGIDYIEGGWPGAIPKDMAFFKRMQGERLRHAKLAAFGSTAHPKYKPQDDPNLKALLESGAPVLTIFGKSWDLHVTEALRIGLDEALAQIEASVRFLKSQGREVIYDAEHFFDAYADNPDYALKTVLAAQSGGADTIVLCETNGGRLPHEVRATIDAVKNKITKPLGIHAHNDADTGVANSLAAVQAGCVHVQGTINGIGERCGNANLVSIIPALVLKMGYRTSIDAEQLKHLRDVSHFVWEMANIRPYHRQPYVGDSAFAHKGGIHVSAVRRLPRTYEHIPPEQVGNQRRILVSEQSGKSNIFEKAAALGHPLDAGNPAVKEVLDRIKTLELDGFDFEAADGSFELLLKKSLKDFKPFFHIVGIRTTNEMGRRGQERCEATVELEVAGECTHTASLGNGPVNALSNAIYKALVGVYPELKKLKLTDYKVRVLSAQEGTASKVRVLIEFTDGERYWSTVGASENVIEASAQAIVDGIELMLERSRAAAPAR